jgi:hypothetical protein
MMVKRKIALALSSSLTGKSHLSALGGRGSGLSQVSSPRGSLLFIKGKQPPARDGHSAIIHEGSMIIFGGDRHHMPYNDVYIFDLLTELTLRQSLLK